MFKLFILILLFFPTKGDKINFCDLSCGKEANTACSNQNCKGVSPDCGPEAIPIPFDDAERTALVELHNLLRNEITLGIDPRFNNTKASNMNVLNYDKELAYMAQCWTNACGWLKHQFHDVCRKTSKFESPGQNLFRRSIPSANVKYDYSNFTPECINEWYSGIDTVNMTIIDSFSDNENETAKQHYTQFMWAETTHFGCGRTEYTVKGVHYLTIVCNYGPGGNIVGKPVYKRGEPCSQCKSGDKCNDKYKGLCGKNIDLHNDTWVPPGAEGTKSKSSKINGYFYNVLPLLYLGLRYI